MIKKYQLDTLMEVIYQFFRLFRYFQVFLDIKLQK